MRNRKGRERAAAVVAAFLALYVLGAACHFDALLGSGSKGKGEGGGGGGGGGRGGGRGRGRGRSRVGRGGLCEGERDRQDEQDDDNQTARRVRTQVRARHVRYEQTAMSCIQPEQIRQQAGHDERSRIKRRGRRQIRMLAEDRRRKRHEHDAEKKQHISIARPRSNRPIKPKMR